MSSSIATEITPRCLRPLFSRASMLALLDMLEPREMSEKMDWPSILLSWICWSQGKVPTSHTVLDMARSRQRTEPSHFTGHVEVKKKDRAVTAHVEVKVKERTVTLYWTY